MSTLVRPRRAAFGRNLHSIPQPGFPVLHERSKSHFNIIGIKLARSKSSITASRHVSSRNSKSSADAPDGNGTEGVKTRAAANGTIHRHEAAANNTSNLQLHGENPNSSVGDGSASYDEDSDQDSSETAGGCFTDWVSNTGYWENPSPVRQKLWEMDPGLNQSLISSGTTVSQLFNQVCVMSPRVCMPWRLCMCMLHGRKQQCKCTIMRPL